MRTGTLLLFTVLAALVGILLIAGGIGYLIWDAKKQRKAAQRKARYPSPSAGFGGASASPPNRGSASK